MGGGVSSDPRSQRDYTSGQHGSTKRQRSRAEVQQGCDRADGGEMRLVPARPLPVCAYRLQVMPEHCVVLRSSRNPEDYQIGALNVWSLWPARRRRHRLLQSHPEETILHNDVVLFIRIRSNTAAAKPMSLELWLEKLANLIELSIEVN